MGVLTTLVTVVIKFTLQKGVVPFDRYVWNASAAYVTGSHTGEFKLPAPDKTTEHLSRRFPTTSWSLIASAGRETPGAADALSALCTAYWMPVYAFIRRKGYSREESEDLSQAFFTRVLEHRTLLEARRERGRFRSFLLASVTHFLANEWDRSHARKRGGDSTTLSFDFESGEETFHREPYHELTPEALFARQWAMTLLDRVLSRQREEYARRGQSVQFDLLKPFLTGDQDRGQHHRLAVQLDMSDAAVRTAVHRLRRQYGELLREEIGATVANPEEMEDEIRFLLAALERA
jgi:RNA polymerase sigma-70 factor (ECF subfamily)